MILCAIKVSQIQIFFRFFFSLLGKPGASSVSELSCSSPIARYYNWLLGILGACSIFFLAGSQMLYIRPGDKEASSPHILWGFCMVQLRGRPRNYSVIWGRCYLNHKIVKLGGRLTMITPCVIWSALQSSGCCEVWMIHPVNIPENKLNQCC